MTAPRPAPLEFKMPLHLMSNWETVLRSVVAQRPDLVSVYLETELRSFIAQRPDPSEFIMPNHTMCI